MRVTLIVFCVHAASAAYGLSSHHVHHTRHGRFSRLHHASGNKTAHPGSLARALTNATTTALISSITSVQAVAELDAIPMSSPLYPSGVAGSTSDAVDIVGYELVTVTVYESSCGPAAAAPTSTPAMILSPSPSDMSDQLVSLSPLSLGTISSYMVVVEQSVTTQANTETTAKAVTECTTSTPSTTLETPVASSAPSQVVTTLLTDGVTAGSSTVSAIPNYSTMTTVGSGSGGSSKRGLLFSGSDTDLSTLLFEDLSSKKVSWLGNWYSGPPPTFKSGMGIEYIPQLYSPQYAKDGSWHSNAQKAIASGTKYFLFYGEPLHVGIPVETAVADFMTYMQPYAAQGVKLGAPGNLQNPKDFEYLAEFLSQCETAGCTVDFVCVHWFWTPGINGQQDFKNAVNNATATGNGRPVWVDNFGTMTTAGDPPPMEDQMEFLQAIIPWLDANDSVERYAYLAQHRTPAGFIAADSNKLTELATLYATM